MVKELAQGHSLSFCPHPMHIEMLLSNSHEASRSGSLNCCPASLLPVSCTFKTPAYWALWHVPGIQALRRLKQEDCSKAEISLWCIVKPCLKSPSITSALLSLACGENLEVHLLWALFERSDSSFHSYKVLPDIGAF